MWKESIEIIWLLLPAAFANMAPVIFKRVNFLNKHINKTLFGSHKTYRGLFFGIFLGILVAVLQSLASVFVKDYSLLNYAFNTKLIFFGAVIGFSALLGDLTKSFFKRKANIPPGDSWIPFDQIDWVVFSLFATSFFVKLNIYHLIFGLIIFPLLTLAVNIISFSLGIRDTKV